MVEKVTISVKLGLVVIQCERGEGKKRRRGEKRGGSACNECEEESTNWRVASLV